MIVATQILINGFLGTGATFAAGVNFIVHLAMGGALIVGVILAKQKRYRAHGACQMTVLPLNVWMIALTMWPSFREQVVPHISRTLKRGYYAIATVHMLLGTSAELLGLYIVLVAGTKLIPPSLRFRHWKRWMRIELVFWFLALTWRSGLTTKARGTLPVNRSSYNLFGELRTASALHALL